MRSTYQSLITITQTWKRKKRRKKKKKRKKKEEKEKTNAPETLSSSHFHFIDTFQTLWS